MSITKVEIRRGNYYDSLILMELQVALTSLPGVQNAGAVMGLQTNKDVLRQSGLLTPQAEAAQADDLIISVEGDSDETVTAALSQVDELLSRKRRSTDQGYRPKTLDTAVRMSPDAGWVSISIPGEYAASVARQALQLQRHVFLYSDNVPLEDEIRLKNDAAEKGLVVMGPDCGTAIINGIGFGFANKVSQGPVGVIAASGTGLQHVTAGIHQLGSGITHAIGTGGRDLSLKVGGVTTRQALELLKSDERTKVIALVSKPPAPEVVKDILQIVHLIPKPVVLNFIGYLPFAGAAADHVYFASTLEETAELAVKLAVGLAHEKHSGRPLTQNENGSRPGFLRGLYSGGTLAYETLLILQDYLPVVYSNIPLNKSHALADLQTSREHTVLDLGDDVFTVGRPHPMLDQSLRLDRLEQEAQDPEVAIILLDVVLGHGAHPDPASELAPVISHVVAQAKETKRDLEIVTVVIGTDEDPQDFQAQIDQLQASGARVETSNAAAARYVGQRLQAIEPTREKPHPIDPSILCKPVAVINVGLESFSESLAGQGAEVVHVEWRPPAGGNEKLMTILERMKG